MTVLRAPSRPVDSSVGLIPPGPSFLAFRFSTQSAAMFLPILMLLFGLAMPLGWIARPDHEHLLAVTSHPLTLLFLLALLTLALFHTAPAIHAALQQAFHHPGRIIVDAPR